MNLIVINRLCDVERKREFDFYNSHINSFRRFNAIDGRSLDLDELIEKGIIEKGLVYSSGAVGSALSHMFLWSGVVESGHMACIFEDDAILCKNFVSESQKIIDSLSSDWDILLFGCNADTTLTVEMLPGITPAVLSFNQDYVRQNSESFKFLDVFSTPFKLIQTLGICGYAISPSGAGKLLDICSCLKNGNFFHYGLNRFLPNTSIDHVMCDSYSRMMSYFSIPPLCITKNDHIKSTVINR